MKLADYFMEILLVALLIFAIVMGVYHISTAESNKVEGIVISCEEGRVIENEGAKVMASYSFASGKITSAMMYNNLANIETQMYNVVVEYEGVQYTIETEEEYSVGSQIIFSIPKE